MEILDRFLSYTRFDTQSSEDASGTPSTPGQMVLARHLYYELKDMGLEEVYLDEYGYLYATLPANTEKKDVPTIGFIAHMDTAPDMSGKDVKARIEPSYQGGDIILSKEDGIILSPKDFPELLSHVGEDLIVTDGHTLLGADDKAGIAEIVSAVAYLQEHPEIAHGKIRIAFNPDEEIGLGAHKFDVDRFGCQWAYTMDGGEVGELEYENFNAAAAKITFLGRNVHPGAAKDKMINAARLAARFIGLLPEKESPEHTQGYEGFFHVLSVSGDVEKTVVSIIVRDHSRERFEERKQLLESLVAQMNEPYGNLTVARLEMRDQYYNMRQMVEPVMHVVDIAREAMLQAGVEPRVSPIRGGTDGAQLSFRGLPCPNIFAGGMNMHGRFEYLPVPSLEKAMRVIVGICALTENRV